LTHHYLQEHSVDNEKVVELLTDIRDANRQLLDEYRRLANDALALQKQALEEQKESIERQKLAVDTQLRHVRLYRIVIFFSFPVVAFMVWLLLRLFRYI
jgi:hypothetical protein